MTSTTTTEVEFPAYNGLTRCPWTPTSDPKTSPHHSLPSPARHNKKICDTVLDLIGETPCVRLSRIAKKHGIKCELVAKCEFFNPGGSVKDRIGYRMVREAQIDGTITPNTTLIEATSGNTGIGLALASAVAGNKLIITMPEKMSKEKANVMTALGATIYRTPSAADWNHPDSHIGLAIKLNKTIPDSMILDQYCNPANDLAHYEWTASEILEQCDNRVDAVVIAVGTGGTISGVGRKFKEKSPKTLVVGVDPRGSILAEPPSLNEDSVGTPYFVEGIGYDFIPTTLDRRVVDKWIKTDDDKSFELARELIFLEGLLAGGSSGSALYGALEIAKDMPEGARVVVLLPDSIRNYVSKFVDDEWMKEKGFTVPVLVRPPDSEASDAAGAVVGGGCKYSALGGGVIGALRKGDGGQPVVEVEGSTPCITVRSIIDALAVEYMVVRDGETPVVGVVTAEHLGKATDECAVKQVMSKAIFTVSETASLHEVMIALNRSDVDYVVSVSEYTSLENNKVLTRKRAHTVVQQDDLIKYMSSVARR